MSEFDLSKSIEAARRDTEQAAKKYIDAQESMVLAENELRDARKKADRLERALRILNGEEEPAAAATAAATTAPPVAPPTPPSTPKPARTDPYASVKCGACNVVGGMHEVFRPTKAGTVAHLLVCDDCNNELYLG